MHTQSRVAQSRTRLTPVVKNPFIQLWRGNGVKRGKTEMPRVYPRKYPAPQARPKPRPPPLNPNPKHLGAVTTTTPIIARQA